jgi:predicted transcriptional regulator YheO
VGDFNTALSDTSTNSTVVDTLMASGVFQLMVAVGIVLGLIGLVLSAVKFRGS